MEQEVLNNVAIGGNTSDIVDALHKEIEEEVREEIKTPVEIKVVYWMSCKDAEKEMRPAIGSWGGGYFNSPKAGLRWVDYLASVDKEIRPQPNLTIAEYWNTINII